MRSITTIENVSNVPATAVAERRDAGRAEEALRCGLRLHLLPVLVTRMRGGLALLLLAILLFSSAGFGLAADEQGAFWAIKAVQLVTVLVGFWLLRIPRSWNVSVAIGIAVTTEVFVTTALSGLQAGETGATFFLFAVLIMGAAMVLPWGAAPQSIICVMALAVVWASHVVQAIPSTILYSGAIGLVLACATSVYAVVQFERYRLGQRRAEERLRESEARNRAVVEVALECIVTVDHIGRVVEFNPAAEATFGYARAEVVGRLLTETIIPPALREAHRQGLARYLTTGNSSVIGRRIETTAMRADGSELPVELTICRMGHGEPPMFTGYLRDLTERRLAAEARASAILVRVGREMMSFLDRSLIVERLASLTAEVLECDATGVLLWDAKGQHYELTAEVGLRSDSGPSDPVSIPRAAMVRLLSQLAHDEVVAVADSRGIGLLPELVRPERPVVSALYVAIGRGEQILGILIAASYTNADELGVEQQSIARGIAQIAAMALTNATLVEEVTSTSQVKSEFLSTMSHELRTPLNAVLGYVDMIEDASDAATQQVLAGRIRGAGHALLELIESSLDIGRIDAGRGDLVLHPVWLPQFWRTVMADCTALPQTSEVTVQWQVDVPAITFVTEARKLVVVIRNLVANALKFTDRGSVRIGVAATDDGVTIRVSDTGVGIRPEDRELIFEMFRQCDGSETRRHEGTGLGLYIVRRFLDQLGGQIALDSTVGKGSTFSVTVPRAVKASVSRAA